MAIPDNFRRILAVFRAEGWPGISRRLRTLWKNLWGYRFYDLYVLEIDDSVELWPARLEKLIGYLRARYTIEWSDDNLRQHLPEYLQRRKDISQPDVLNWIASGHRTVIIRDRNKTVGDCWLATQKFPFPTKNRALSRWTADHGYAYSYMAFVEPGYRGLGVFPLLLAEQVELARDNGHKGLMGVVLPRSESSKQSLESMGFTNKGRLHILRLFGKNTTRAVFRSHPEEGHSAD